MRKLWLVLALADGSACAQPSLPGYPSKPIKLVAPFPPGGSADFTARVIAEHFSKVFGQPTVVENVPGGGA